MKITAAFPAFLLLLLCACTQQKPSPDEIRERTAQATSDIARDAKAVAEGVKEGWDRNQALDLNQASKAQLLSLQGVGNETADRVIAGRPYSSASELVSRRIVSQAEFDKIKDQVTAKN